MNTRKHEDSEWLFDSKEFERYNSSDVNNINSFNEIRDAEFSINADSSTRNAFETKKFPFDIHDNFLKNFNETYNAELEMNSQPHSHSEADSEGIMFSSTVVKNQCNGETPCNDPTCNLCEPDSYLRRRKNLAGIKSDSIKFNSYDLKGMDTSELPSNGFCCFPSKAKDDEDESDSSFSSFMNSWGTFFIRPFSVVEPECTPVKQFNLFFVWTSLLSFVIDPLFFLLIHIDKEIFCLRLDSKFLIVLVVFRTFSDLMFAFHTYLGFRTTIIMPSDKKYWWGGKYAGKDTKPGEMIKDRKSIIKNYLNNFFIFDLFAMLPLPQLFLVFITTSGYESTLRIIVLLQFIPRFVVLSPILNGSLFSSNYGIVFESAAYSSLYSLILFLIVSHFIGCGWYYLALHRTERCIYSACKNYNSSSTPSFSCTSFLSCNERSGLASKVSNFSSILSGINLTCFIDPASNPPSSSPSNSSMSDVFQYGIYLNALSIVTESHLIQKYVFSFFWGFQQICTLANNQTPSVQLGEVFFVIFIIGIGLLLFASLIGNIQSFLLSFTTMSFEYQIQRRTRQIWADQKNLPLSLKRKLKSFERHSWMVSKGFHEEEAFNSLTDDLRRDIKHHFCSNFVQNSSLFSAMDECVLDAIFDHATPCVFEGGTILAKQKYPVKRMIFLLKGQVEFCVFDHSSSPSHGLHLLSEGDFMGEELLAHFLPNLDSSCKKQKFYANQEEEGEGSSDEEEEDADVLPLSEKTAICITPVQAYSLEAQDLKYICFQFKRNLLHPRVQRVLNASSLMKRIQQP